MNRTHPACRGLRTSIALVAAALLPGLVAGPGLAAQATASPASGAEINVPTVSDEQRLDTILERFDLAQIDIHTLQADFGERKKLAMLVEPLVSTGRFYYESPDRAKWEYLEPDRRIFVISDNALMQYFPDNKTLEKKDLSSVYTHRIFKLFGLGQTSAELRNYYDISLGETEAGADTYLLVLRPIRRRLEKRLSHVLLWVGDQDFLPRAMESEEADGDVTHLEFTHVTINGVLADGTFRIDVPDDVEIRDQISLFSDSGDGSSP